MPSEIGSKMRNVRGVKEFEEQIDSKQELSNDSEYRCSFLCICLNFNVYQLCEGAKFQHQ